MSTDTREYIRIPETVQLFLVYYNRAKNGFEQMESKFFVLLIGIMFGTYSGIVSAFFSFIIMKKFFIAFIVGFGIANLITYLRYCKRSNQSIIDLIRNKRTPAENTFIKDPFHTAIYNIHRAILLLNQKINAWNVYINGSDLGKLRRHTDHEQRLAKMDQAIEEGKHQIGVAMWLISLIEQHRSGHASEHLNIEEVQEQLREAASRMDAFFELETDIEGCVQGALEAAVEINTSTGVRATTALATTR